MICDKTDLGDFEYCDGVNIEFVDSTVVVKNIETKYRCAYDDGDFGKLNPGHYYFDFEDNQYTFQVT